ncbi:hypothetical protein Tco_0799002, partial [Tanacetum coccineum]
MTSPSILSTTSITSLLEYLVTKALCHLLSPSCSSGLQKILPLCLASLLALPTYHSSFHDSAK